MGRHIHVPHSFLIVAGKSVFQEGNVFCRNIYNTTTDYAWSEATVSR
jgi:hypothetical protein